MKKDPKIILWDIEILSDPDKLCDDFGLYEGYTLKNDISTMISFGYKIYGQKKAKCINAWDFPKRWAKNVNDDYELCKAASEILQDADAMVTHYGSRFDLKFLNGRLIHHGLPTIPKIIHIDTCMVARSKLHMSRNRLNSLAKFLGVEEKMQNGGAKLWREVRNRKKKALKTMNDYCKQDVEVLEQVFVKLRPLIDTIPNYNLFRLDADDKLCPCCGSKKIHKHGLRSTKTTVYQRYRCSDCGSSFRGKERIATSRIIK